MNMTLNFDTDEFMAAILQAVSGKLFEIAEDVRREMGADGTLITIHRNLNSDHSADGMSVLEFKAPAQNEAVLQRFKETFLARTRQQ
ncbi:MAG: hypothetical protein ACP5I8_15690 [Phycisphaerae bacterium]